MSIWSGYHRLRWIFLLILFTTAAGFFIPMPLTGWAGPVVKGALFLVDLLLITTVFLAPASGRAGRMRPEAVPDAADGLEDVGQSGESGDDPWKGFGTAFRTFCREYLGVVRQSFSASAAGFYLRSRQGTFRLHTADGYADDPDYHAMTEGTLVERVGQARTHHLTGQLPKGSSIPGIPGASVRSFLGVPIVRDNKAVAVLAVGSEAENDFGDEDRNLLVSYGNLLAQTMAVYHRAFRIETERDVFQVRLDLEANLQTAEDDDAAFKAFSESIGRLFPFDRFTVCLADRGEGMIRYVMGQMDHQKPGMRFSLESGLCGWVMKRNTPILIADILEGSYARPRYQPGEDAGHGLHAFLCVPLGGGEATKGCLSLESHHIGQYDDQAKAVLIGLGGQLDHSLERIRIVRALRSGGNKPMPPGFEME